MLTPCPYDNVATGPIPKRTVRGDEAVRLEPFDLLTLAIEFDGDPMDLVGIGPVTHTL